MQHLVSGCEMLTYKEYQRLHDNVAKKVHWNLCKKNEFDYKEKWYEHVPEGAVENEDMKLLWDINILCDNVIAARRPDIVVIIDIAVPDDLRVGEKESEIEERD